MNRERDRIPPHPHPHPRSARHPPSARQPPPAPSRRPARALLPGLVAAVLLAAGCDGSSGGPPAPPRPSPPPPSATPAGKPGGTLRIAGTNDLSGDPGWAGTDAERLLVRMVSRQLYSYPADPDPQSPVTPTPDLADGPPQVGDGGRTWAVRLRPTVRWDVPAMRRVTATDVARGIKRLCTPPRPAPLRGYFAATITGFAAYCDGLARTRPAGARGYVEGRSLPGVQVVGDDTVVFKLLRPANDFASILALPAASPVPLEVLAAPPDSPAYRSHLVSDGPYRFADPKPGETARLSRNPVWDPASDPLRRAYVDHVTLKLRLSTGAVQEQLERGQADMSWDTAVPPARVSALRARRDLRLSLTGPPSLVVLVYGLRGPAAGVLRSALVRQALTWCVDKRVLLPALGGPDLAQPTGQFLLPGMDGYRPRDPYATSGSRGNPERCRSLLARAGHPGLELVLLQPDTPAGVAVAGALAASLARAGVRVSPLVVPAGDAARRLADPRAGGWDLAVAPAYRPPWSGAAGRTIFQPLLDARWAGPKPVDTGYRSPAVTRGIDAALAATGSTQAADRWAALEAAVQRDAPLVPLATVVTPRFHGANVRNWVLLPALGNGDPTNVALGVT